MKLALPPSERLPQILTSRKTRIKTGLLLGAGRISTCSDSNIQKNKD